jgi:hypothetical protein
MSTRKKKCSLEFQHSRLLIHAVSVLFLMLFNVIQTVAQNAIPTESGTTMSVTTDSTGKSTGYKITNSGYGGIILKFSRFKDQFVFMTGGHGACTINERYTIGGGGYGIASSVKLSGSNPDTSRNFKMGYGGLELGYIFFPGKKVNIVGTVLFAAGAAFWQNKPKSKGEKLFGNDFKIFPVLEPSVYFEFALNRIMRMHTGISYRYVYHTDLDYIKDQNIRGFSCFAGLIFGKT